MSTDPAYDPSSRSRKSSKSSKSSKPSSSSTSQYRSRSRKPSKGDPSPPDPEPIEDPPDSTTTFPNYEYRGDRRILYFLLLLFELIVFCFLAVVVFAEPFMMSGGSSVFRDITGKEYVGVLRKCTDTTCDPWMGGATSGSAGTGSTGGDAPVPPGKRSLSPRADGSFDYGSMFLTTGLATLAAFWISLYTFLFTILRFMFWSTPPDPESTTWKDGMKRFIYQVIRAFLIVNSILIPAIMLDCVVKGMQYRTARSLTGANGIGVGIALILLAGLFTIFCALIETRRPGGRTHRFFLKLTCGGSCLCLTCFTDPEVRSSGADIEMGRMSEKGK